MSPGRGLPDSSTGPVEKGIGKLAVGHVAIWTFGADVPIELRFRSVTLGAALTLRFSRALVRLAVSAV
jgi:hypothetical protein